MAHPVAKFLVPVTAYTASDAVNRRVVISSPIWGAKYPNDELSVLPVNGRTAWTCGKWPILRGKPFSQRLPGVPTTLPKAPLPGLCGCASQSLR